MVMIKAEEWLSYFDSHSELEFARMRVVVRKIQADAIRYAANMSGDDKNVALLKEADNLEINPCIPEPKV